MAIVTLDQALAGMRPGDQIMKIGVAMEAAGLTHSHFYSGGSPGAAVAPTPGVNGATLTTYAGQIPWVNPASGNAHLARLSLCANVGCTVLLCDRIWHNSGLSVTLTTSQAITTPTWEPRDKNGATLGHDLVCGLEWSAAGGAGVPTVTLTYTNQDNASGRTGVITGVTGPNTGTFERFPLQAGDTGIRSIQALIQNATRTSGTMHLVVYRVLAQIPLTTPNLGVTIDPLTSGFPRLYNNTVPFFLQMPSAVTATTLTGHMIVTHG